MNNKSKIWKIYLIVFFLALLIYLLPEAGYAWLAVDESNSALFNIRIILIWAISLGFPLIYAVYLTFFLGKKPGYFSSLIVLEIILVSPLAMAILFSLFVTGEIHHFFYGMTPGLTRFFILGSALLIFISYTSAFCICWLIKGQRGKGIANRVQLLIK